MNRLERTMRKVEKELAEQEKECEAMEHKNMRKISALITEMEDKDWELMGFHPENGTVFWAWSPRFLPYKCSCVDGAFFVHKKNGEKMEIISPVLYKLII